MRRIGILTSGGDCSGLNSVIRAAAIRSKNLGYELLGIKRGVSGLTADKQDYVILCETSCDEMMLTTSGSVLYSDTKSLRTEKHMTRDEFKSRIVAGYRCLSLDGLIYIGGDGSLHMMHELSLSEELRLVAIPKTIDNDVSETDFSVGFLTAVEVVSNAIENVRATARSHERAMIVEVMGRDSGFIAMYAGIASGADAILVPEFGYHFESLKEDIKKRYDSGRDHAIILVSEAVQSADLVHDRKVVDGVVKFYQSEYKGIGNHIATQLKEAGFESRSVALGHIQRGGKTSIADRLLGSSLGVEAVNAMHSGEDGCFLAYSGGHIVRIPIKDIGDSTGRKLDRSSICVRTAVDLGIYIGDVSS
jgi:6-phosphofructokinase 1